MKKQNPFDNSKSMSASFATLSLIIIPFEYYMIKDIFFTSHDFQISLGFLLITAALFALLIISQIASILHPFLFWKELDNN